MHQNYQGLKSGFQKNDLLFITKNTRGRHSLPKAEKSKNYLVLSSYTNQLGTTKYIVINEMGVEHFTTEKSAEKVEEFKIINLKNEKNYNINVNKNETKFIKANIYNSKIKILLADSTSKIVFYNSKIEGTNIETKIS